MVSKVGFLSKRLESQHAVIVHILVWSVAALNNTYILTEHQHFIVQMLLKVNFYGGAQL